VTLAASTPEYVHVHLRVAIGRQAWTATRSFNKESFAAQSRYRAVTHQRFVGTGYFDEIARVFPAANSSTTALSARRKPTVSRRVPLAPTNGHASETRA